MSGRISDERRAKLEACRDCGTKPLPCPFCGKPALIYGTNLVGCSDTVNCGGEVDFGHWTGIENGIYAEHHVIQQWNKRHELQQSRALVTELQFKLEGATDLHRALVLQLGAMADGLRKDIPEPSPDHSPLQSQKSIFARKFLFEIDSLLAAHDTQQAEGRE